MTEEQMREILQELEYDQDYQTLLNVKLYNVVNEKLNQPVTKIEELFLGPGGHMQPMDEAGAYVFDTYEIDNHVNMSKAKNAVKRAIVASYFITAALDRLVSKAKSTNKIFTDKKGEGTFKFDFMIYWSFVNGVFQHVPCFYLHLNDTSSTKTKREIDFGITIKFSTEHGWMNWPLEIKTVDYYKQKAHLVDFIKCLEDFNFNNIQKAINLVF